MIARVFRGRFAKCLAPLAVLMLVLVVAPPAADAALTNLEGAGASFPQLEFEQWRSDVKREFDLKLNYVSSGSTFGRNQYILNLVDFGVSDIPFQIDEIQNANKRPFVYVPVSAGGVGLMYNLTDTSGRRIGVPTSAGGTGTDLKLTQSAACRLLSDVTMKWNDPELVAANPDISLPNIPVQRIVRSDGAGTSYVMQEYCIATAPAVWQKFVDFVKADAARRAAMSSDPFLDGKPSSRWPSTGMANTSTAFAGDGVANAVVGTAGSVTYDEAAFAETRNYPNALMRNSAGVFNYPEAYNVSVALSYATLAGDGTVTLNYTGSNPDAYFPSSYSYVIAPKTPSSATGQSLGTFLNYAITLGQQRADQLGYAPLSRQIVEIALNAVQQIAGAPPKPEIVVYTPGTGSPDPNPGGTPDPNPGGGGTNPGGTPDPNPGGGGTNPGGTPDPNPGGGGTNPGTGSETGGTGATNGGNGSGSNSGTGANSSGQQSGGSVTTRSATAATTTAPLGATTTRALSASGGNQSASPAVRNAASGSAAPAAGGPIERRSSAPTNSEALVAVLQGGVLCAAAFALARRFIGSS